MNPRLVSIPESASTVEKIQNQDNFQVAPEGTQSMPINS